MFFNLFVAAEPYTSVKVTHGTPRIDPYQSSDVREVEARLISLAGHCGESRHENDKADKD